MSGATARPPVVPAESLPAWLAERNIPHVAVGRLDLGFGAGQPQYALFPYAAPRPEESMGLFFEWHTEDFFDAPENAHLAVGLRGPRPDDPHRGRGLALGMLACRTRRRDGDIVPLFSGCPEPPGGPAVFLEEFTVNDGRSAISNWQLTECRPVPALRGGGVYRVDLHVSRTAVWAAVWERRGDDHRFLVQTSTVLDPPRAAGEDPPSSAEHPSDRGWGNVFIGNGFARPDNRSFVDRIVIAHW